MSARLGVGARVEMSVSTEADDSTWDMARGDFFKHDTMTFGQHFPCATCAHRTKDIAECCKFCRYYCGGKKG